MTNHASALEWLYNTNIHIEIYLLGNLPLMYALKYLYHFPTPAVRGSDVIVAQKRIEVIFDEQHLNLKTSVCKYELCPGFKAQCAV